LVREEFNRLRHDKKSDFKDLNDDEKLRIISKTKTIFESPNHYGSLDEVIQATVEKMKENFHSAATKITKTPILSEEYDPKKYYIPRSQRKEWIAVKMFGRVVVKDNGKCLVGSLCDINNDGTAYPGKTYHVLNRISTDTIEILFR
jgi:hypothetical protein